MHRIASGCAAIALAGCLVNVPLQAPPPNAPPEVRMQAYANLAPAGTAVDTSVTVTNHAAYVSQSTELILHDGQTVYDPTDLLPVIDAQSVAAQAAQRSASARTTAAYWALAGMIAVVAGGIVLGADGIQSGGFDAAGNPTPAGLNTTGDVALVAILAGAVIGGIGAGYYRHVAHEQKLVAFATYDDALRAHLRICTNGMQVVACP
jgi:hypothetical protein